MQKVYVRACAFIYFIPVAFFINCHTRMPQIGVSFFSLITSRAVCYRMIDWKKDIELLNERALKSLECLGLGVETGTLE